MRHPTVAEGRAGRRALSLLAVGMSVACAGTTLATAGAAGGQQASVRLTGEISVRANRTGTAGSLTFTGRATFDVTLTTHPEKFAVVPMTYDWTGTSGSCSWGGSGSDGELRLRLQALAGGRLNLSINGTTPDTECNRDHRGMLFYLASILVEPGVTAIAPEVNWDYLVSRGTGTLSFKCTGCAAPAGARYDVRAMWGRRIEFKPREPRAGQLVRMSENVVVLERPTTDSHWTEVKSPNVKAKCKIYLGSGRNQRTTFVPGHWRTPSETRGDGVVACAPWRIPSNARPGSWLGFSPVVTYRGKTLTTKRSFWTRIARYAN